MKPIQDYAAEILERHDKNLVQKIMSAERTISGMEEQIVQEAADLRELKAQLIELRAAKSKLALASVP